MKKEDEELTLEEQVERIRQRRNRRADAGRLRQVLNTAFLVLAAIGLGLPEAGIDERQPYALLPGVQPRGGT